ncbi:MAG: hypothetical protein ACKVJU_22240 [Verrucomicrobiales bacterium]
MKTPLKHSLIGGAVLLIAVFGIVVIVGPKKALGSVYFALSSDTEFAPEFSEKAFLEIEIGDSESVVLAALGKAIEERDTKAYSKLLFANASASDFEKEGITNGDLDFSVFRFSAEGNLQSGYGQIFGGRSGSGLANVQVTIGMGDGQNFLGIKNTEIESLKKAGATRMEIEAKFGKPSGVFKSKVVRWLVYSKSPSSGNYQRCWIGLDAEGNVAVIKAERYWD